MFIVYVKVFRAFVEGDGSMSAEFDSYKMVALLCSFEKPVFKHCLRLDRIFSSIKARRQKI